MEVKRVRHLGSDGGVGYLGRVVVPAVVTGLGGPGRVGLPDTLGQHFRPVHIVDGALVVRSLLISRH